MRTFPAQVFERRSVSKRLMFLDLRHWKPAEAGGDGETAAVPSAESKAEVTGSDHFLEVVIKEANVGKEVKHTM